MSKTSPSLGNIPDDLILDILKHLDTARDVAHFEATSKWTRRLVRQSGWRDFVKTRFSSLGPLPTSSGVSDEGGCWGRLADRLTYQDRCWNRRGFYLTAYDEIPPQGRGGARRNFAGQSVGFQSVMAAAVVSSGLRQEEEEEEELFVFGAGEDILFRRRPTASETRDVWAKLTGHETGYAAGTGDVTALSILERGGSSAAPEVVVGRATGELQLLSADFATLGHSPQALLPLNEPSIGSSRTSPGQVAVSWTEWEARNQILASCRNSILTLYNLGPSAEEEPSLQPVAFHDAADSRNLPGETSFMRSVKFMAPDVLACGLGGTCQPLRWARLRPEGVIEVFNAAKNSQIARSSALERGRDEKTTVRAIEPVRGLNPNVLLSAWDDGSHRLSDLRTPSEHDAVYRDRFQLYQASSSILVYGAERFVAGNNWSPSIRFFDFRFPRSYEHHTALPCSPYAPVPSRPMQREKLPLDSEHQRFAARCKHESGRRCVWHDLSSQPSWRPDAMLHMGGPSLDRVYSLSKASDTSSSFHVGFRGSFTEITLGLTGRVSQEAKLRTAPEGWRATSPRDKISLMETGLGLYKGEDDLAEECMGVPRMYFHRPSRGHEEEEQEEEEEMVDGRAGLSRLDGAYRTGHGRRVWE